MFIKNTIRVVVEEVPEIMWFSWFVTCWRKRLELTGTDIFSVNEFRNQGIYDVTFVSEPCCLTIFEWLRSHDGDPCLEGVRVEPLFGLMEKVVTVTVYNPYTEVSLLEQFLARYCEYVKGGEKQKNCLGIFNCKYVFRVKLRRDPSCLGGFAHPPANFSVAGQRGFLTYAGQPLYCRKCFQFGHLQSTCEKSMVCRNCKQEGHMAAQCLMPRECDQCGDIGHLYRDCPYAGPRRPTREEERREEEGKKREERRQEEEKKREEEVKKREEERRREESKSSAQESAEIIPPSMVEIRRDRRQEDKEAERRKEELEDKLFWRAAKQEERAMTNKSKKKKDVPVTNTEELGALMDFDILGRRRWLIL
ncbi:unnamed protein product [Ranitomeya imitator]|uniref:CCHC-type domain-containing protein n=1 Tax=Ranitomeya imitator TaxID=111125 RepID=A0ABN9MKG9_9NEOB|nr:unnamed protein product [Ranitomeya imitator]